MSAFWQRPAPDDEPVLDVQEPGPGAKRAHRPNQEIVDARDRYGTLPLLMITRKCSIGAHDDEEALTKLRNLHP